MEGDKKRTDTGTFDDAVILDTALIFYFFKVWTKYLEMRFIVISYKKREKTVKKFP
jgi:hypothetical protein